LHQGRVALDGPVADVVDDPLIRRPLGIRSLGLEQYEAAFRENAIDDAVLLDG
jgi:hypothetical protein